MLAGILSVATEDEDYYGYKTNREVVDMCIKAWRLWRLRTAQSNLLARSATPTYKPHLLSPCHRHWILAMYTYEENAVSR